MPLDIEAATAKPSQTDADTFRLVVGPNNAVGIQFIGRIDHKSATVLLQQLLREIKSRNPSKVTVDLYQTTYFDDFGALVLFELRSFLDNRKIPFHIVQPPQKAGEILTLTNFENPQLCAPLPRPYRHNLFVRTGESFLKTIFNLRYMTAFFGSVVLCILEILRHPRRLRLNDTILLMQKVGVDAVPIVGLISFLLGLIMAFVSSMQLEQFGANIYVAALVALIMVSELGPIMTAVVVAGRSGSAFAAEIGTMRISDEIDALFTMGISPTLFLAVPRLIATMIVVPLLTLFADLFAMLGGLTISIAMLDLTISTYVTQTINSLTLFEFFWGTIKSIIFAVLIALVGCLRGFQVRGGASEVGNAATSAVVSGIFFIILFDSIFAVIRSYW